MYIFYVAVADVLLKHIYRKSFQIPGLEKKIEK